jgi:hypothetical protein
MTTEQSSIESDSWILNPKTKPKYVPAPFTWRDYAQYAIYLDYCYRNNIQVED